MATRSRSSIVPPVFRNGWFVKFADEALGGWEGGRSPGSVRLTAGNRRNYEGVLYTTQQRVACPHQFRFIEWLQDFETRFNPRKAGFPVQNTGNCRKKKTTG